MRFRHHRRRLCHQRNLNLAPEA